MAPSDILQNGRPYYEKAEKEKLSFCVGFFVG